MNNAEPTEGKEEDVELTVMETIDETNTEEVDGL